MTYPPTPTPPPQASQVCPRHPDRISYVRCQRCGRPVCPECQRPAAVGVQCVDCVASAQVRPTRSALGARLDGRGPIVTYTIIGICLAVFVVQLARPDTWVEFGFVPAFAEAQPYRFLTAAFLHSTSFLLHIAFNMYLLWLVGPFLEELLGRSRFIALYLLSAVGGSVAVLLLANPQTLDWISVTIGASGAVFGLFGALLMVMRRLQRNVTQILVFFAINGVLGFVVPNISWQGHLGGLVVGLALGAIFAYAPQGRRVLVSWAGVVGITVALLLAIQVGFGIGPQFPA